MRTSKHLRTTGPTSRKLVAAAGKTGVVAAAVGLAVGAFTPAASADGAQTQTLHAHGVAAAGLEVIDFNPNSSNRPPVTPPDGCWLSDTTALVSTGGEAVLHMIGNTTGFWLTDTYAGSAAVYPLVLDNGVPVTDSEGNDEVDTTQPPLVTGHLAVWLGEEDNSQNGVFHSTLNFQGTDASGTARDLTGHFQFTIDANGQPTVSLGSLTC